MATPPGRNFFGTAHAGGPAAPIVGDDSLTITSVVPSMITGATVTMPYPAYGVISVDTEGTGISSFIDPDGLHLYGFDTLANYQAVLRTMRLAAPLAAAGQTMTLQISMGALGPGGQFFYTTAPATSVIEVTGPLPPVVDVEWC